MKWQKLSNERGLLLGLGTLLRFSAGYPFEGEVVMMVCDSPPESRLKLALMTITGCKAGRNCFLAFPDSAHNEEGWLTADWLYDNWRHWVWPEGNPDDVFILPGGLSANDLK